MASTIKQRLRRFNGTDYDTIHLETEKSCITDFPSSMPPTAHQHSQDDISGLGLSLNTRAIEFTKWESGSEIGGYIDFHYEGSTADYTSRIAECPSGTITIDAPNGLYLNGNAITGGRNVSVFDNTQVCPDLLYTNTADETLNSSSISDELVTTITNNYPVIQIALAADNYEYKGSSTKYDGQFGMHKHSDNDASLLASAPGYVTPSTTLTYSGTLWSPVLWRNADSAYTRPSGVRDMFYINIWPMITSSAYAYCAFGRSTGYNDSWVLDYGRRITRVSGTATYKIYGHR